MLIEFLAKVEIPIVTGIGHQMDVTLADHIADLRMSTPSAVAEKASTTTYTKISKLHTSNQ